MVQSKFVLDILTMILDDDNDGLQLKSQLPFIEENKFDYTGMGVFVSFRHLPGIEEYMTPTYKLILDGLFIKSPDLAIGAEAIVHVSNGLIDYLEIWSFGGDYVERDLKQYILKKNWLQ